MILSNDKMLFFTQCQRFKLFYSQHSFKAPLTQIGIYLNPHINFYHRFFLHVGVSVHMKPMNPLTAKPHLFETALPNDCLQCIMGIA